MPVNTICPVTAEDKVKALMLHQTRLGFDMTAKLIVDAVEADFIRRTADKMGIDVEDVKDELATRRK